MIHSGVLGALKHRYVFWGLRVSSEIPLPEWRAFENPAGFDEPDVRISRGESLREKRSEEVALFADEDECRFFFPEAGEFRVREGREIVVRPAPGAGEREVRLFLLGTAWGAVCYQRGVFFLHAGAVKIGERAVAFCGPAGSGKSTLAAWLTLRGRPLVADDLCRFHVSRSHPPVVYPSAPRLKLWRDALDVLGRGHEDLERDHFRLDKFHWPMEGKGASAPLPLSSVCLLDWGEPALVRLKGLDAVKSLVASAAYRGELLEPMGRLGWHWERCAELARRVPVRRFTRPKDPGGMEKGVALLEESIRGPA